MAAIRLDEGVAWVKAGWVFRYVVESVYQQSLGTPLEHLIFPAPITGYLDLTGFSTTDLKMVRGMISKRIADLREAGPTSLGAPVAFDGLLAALEELEGMLNDKLHRMEK